MSLFFDVRVVTECSKAKQDNVTSVCLGAFSTSLYILELFHCVKASCTVLVGREFTEMNQLLQTSLYSLKKLNFMLPMSSVQGYTVSSWDRDIWVETWLSLQ